MFGMSVLENTLYYSNIRSGVHQEIENEREALVQEQRYCRAQARKLSLETNRRRKALEERRKQWDVQEQRLRENILQQRHQRVQDATENFQRAHLPRSQRKRPAAFKRRTVNLDEALHHIQGSPHLYIQQLPFLAGASTISRSCIPSSKPSGVAHHLRALSAAEAYAKLLQEKSLSNLKNNQLLFPSEQQETQKEKEQADPQMRLQTVPGAGVERTGYVWTGLQQLWHGVRNALSSKDVRSPIRRQAMESNMVKNRVSLENSRNQPTGTTQRKPSFPFQVTVPKPQLPNKNSHAAESEGPEVSDGAHEVVDCAQIHKFCNGPIAPLSQRIKSLNVSALSLEEQKILQSLERLNQRLQYVRDAAGVIPAVKGIFALGPAFNQTGETVGVTVRRRRASADNRTQTQQRYRLHRP